MNRVLAAGLPPDVPGLLARRLPGALVEEQGSPRDAAAALRREAWTLAAVDAAWLEPPLVAELARLRGSPGAPTVLVLSRAGPGQPPEPALAEVGAARVFPHPLDREALAREAADRLRLAAASPSASAGPAGVGAAVAGVWARYRDRVLERVDVLEAAAIDLLEGRLEREARRAAEREAHKLAGSAGSFGFPEASRLSREAETLLGAPHEPGQAGALRLAELAVALRRELTGLPAAGAAPPSGPRRPGAGGEPAALPRGPAEEGEPPVLLIVDGDREGAERVAMEASARGMRPEVAHGAAEARAALGRVRPGAALLDIAVDGGMELLRSLAGATPSVPTVVLTGSGTLADRVEVARLGGQGFLAKPLPPARAVDAVEPLLRPGPPGATVLAVDDDPAVLEAIGFVLQPHGIRVEALTRPERFWEALEAAAPDVVLLDVDMPGVNGLELCRVLRNDPRWRGVPVVFLTARVDPATVQAVFAAGADDFVGKPFVGPELGARILNRLERVRLQRSLAETDPLTGVPNRRGSEEVLDRFLRLAAARGDPLALGLVDLDRFKEVNDRWGHAVGDAVLARVARLLHKRFRAQDVVARWGGEEFVVGMYGMDRADGVQRLADVLELLREERFTAPGGEPFRVTFSAGVAEFGADGRDLQSLYRAADAAMYAAKEAGRDRVLPTGWRTGGGDGPRMVDVLVVEDDPALAGLLRHALETRGLRHEWVDDGRRAAALLTDPDGGLRARVVLLDVDLPGLDGMGVLRLLADARLLERTRVIVLTVRSHESEVVRALELGAFDHVSKPFSVPVLLQRVRRALRA